MVLTLIAIGLFLNLAMYLRVTPAGASLEVSDLVRTRQLEIVNDDGVTVVHAYSLAGGGAFSIRNKSGGPLVSANGWGGFGPDFSRDDGGQISVFNKTGERVITLDADEYGNGVVGAWNRKGKDRTLESK